MVVDRLGPRLVVAVDGIGIGARHFRAGAGEGLMRVKYENLFKHISAVLTFVFPPPPSASPCAPP